MPTPDPFAALEEAVARQEAEEKAMRALTQARCRLVLGKDARSAFFATLALRLVPEVDWTLGTMSTNGRLLHLNPRFVTGLNADELLGVVAHEVLHNALSHHSRRGQRDPETWNTACDLAVNPLLLEAGFTLPADRFLPGEGRFQHLPSGKSAEEYYTLLTEEQSGSKSQQDHEDQEKPPRGGQDQGTSTQGDGPGERPGCPDPGRCGGVRDPGTGSQAETRQSEAEWEVAVAQAEQVAHQRGTLPGGLSRLVERVLRPAVDWREVLRQFVSSHARNDYSWSPPNRRFVHAGLYLPGLRSEELGDVVLAVDTSGSIGQKELDRFASEAQNILEAFDCSLTVLYHDTEVQQVQHWRSSDGPLVLEPVGGGGTSHACVFDWIEQEGLAPTCVVCLTDLHTEFPDTVPAVPVLWAVVGSNARQPPFGLRVTIDVSGGPS